MCHSWNWQETRVVFRSRGLDSTTVLYCRERPTVSSLPNLSLDSKKAASTSPKRARSPLSLSMAHASVRGGIFSKCTRPRTSTDGTCRCAMLYRLATRSTCVGGVVYYYFFIAVFIAGIDDDSLPTPLSSLILIDNSYLLVLVLIDYR